MDYPVLLFISIVIRLKIYQCHFIVPEKSEIKINALCVRCFCTELDERKTIQGYRKNIHQYFALIQ